MAGKKDIVERAIKLVAGSEPQMTAKAYKLFKQREGKLYPLFVDAKEEVPVGQWLKAKAGDLLPSGKVKAEISGGLAYRPGWHAGDLPTATHIGAKSHGNPKLPPDTRRSDEVWAEVDMANDVDWQKVADERARITKKGTPDPKTAHITDQVPYGGFYRYKTSPTMQGNWMIGGDMRVNRLLSDDEVKTINDAAGVADLPRREGYAPGGEVDPYADEVASAKARIADQQYSNQSWSDWTGDVVGNALNTAKSILPTALGGKGEVGISDMARGAYEAGKDAVTFPGDVISGKQPLFDERGRPLEQAVGRSFNAASTLGGASSVVPKPSNSLGVFGGIGSRTADRNALTKAQIMERQGASPEDIWQQTGWGRGAEEKWRYEIPDTNAVIRTHAFQPVVSKSGTPYKRATLAELLDHPELFAAYPEFKNMQVNETFNDVNGYYMPRFERGTINPGFSDPYIALNLKNLPLDENKFSTLLHEAQHGIQQKEGFAPGSNSGNFEPDTVPNPSHKIYKEAEASDPAFQEFHYILNSPDYKKEINASNALFDAEVQPRLDALAKEQKATGKDLYDEMDAILNEHRLSIRNKFPQIHRLDELGESLRRRDIPLKEPKKFLTPEEAYRHAAGEVEARNVQSRRDMPLEELRSTAPWKTEEYPKERQIIDWNDTSWRKGYDTGGRIGGNNSVSNAINMARGFYGDK